LAVLDAEAIFDFFLLIFSFSPALTTSDSSFLHWGQYLSQHTPLDTVSMSCALQQFTSP